MSTVVYPEDVIPVGREEHVAAGPLGVDVHLLRPGVVTDDVVGPVVVQDPVLGEYLL